jgi:hypothetical protein
MNLTPIIEQKQEEAKTVMVRNLPVDADVYEELDTLISTTAHAVHEATVAEVVRIIRDVRDEHNVARHGENYEDAYYRVLTALTDQKSAYETAKERDNAFQEALYKAKDRLMFDGVTDQKITKEDYKREKRYEAVELATSLMFKLGTRPVADGIDRDYHQGLKDMRDAIAKAHGVDLPK